MKKNWGFFAGSAILAAYFLIAAGAPIVPVAGGIVLGAVMTYRATRTA